MKYIFEVTLIDSPWPVAVPLDLRDDDMAIAYASRVFKQLEAVYRRENSCPRIVLRKQDRDLFD
jgi:hypothetical protein